MNNSRPVSEILLDNFEKTQDIFNKYSVSEVRIFGSLASNKDTAKSDIDFLIKMPQRATYVQYGHLKNELEDLLKVPIDLLTYSGLDKKALDHFIAHSISLREFKCFCKNDYIKDSLSMDDRVQMNLKSILWVIERITSITTDLSLDAYMKDPLVLDALSRNIQLLGQVISQIPPQALENFDSVNTYLLKGFMPLKEALFLNVDCVLLRQTLEKDLDLVKINIQELLDQFESKSNT